MRKGSVWIWDLHRLNNFTVSWGRHGKYRRTEDIFSKATSLSPEELSRLIGDLSKMLHDKYGKWTALEDVEEMRNYLEWSRFRDSRHSDEQRKSPEEFLAELGEDE